MTDARELVNVRDLVWHTKLQSGEREGFVCTQDSDVSYSIMLRCFRVYGIPGEHDGAAEFGSLAAAKAAAQADYTARILAALDLTGVDAMQAENKRLKDALISIDALDPEQQIDGFSVAAMRGLVLRMGEIARAALKESDNA